MDALKIESDTLRTLEKRQQGGAIVLLSSLVVNLADAFNVGKNMSAEQCMETAVAILEEFPLFTVNDIALCFNKAKKGAYGKVFDRLDCSTIFGFLEQYYEAKLIALEKYNREKAKPAEPPTEDTPEQKKRFSENIAKIKATLAAKQSPPKPVATVGNTSDRFQGWIKQFDKYHQQNGKITAGMKFIKKYGRWMDVNTYLEYKSQQYQRVFS